MKGVVIATCLFTFLFWGCEKLDEGAQLSPDFGTPNEQPVFELKAQFNDSDLEIAAGQDNYYMFTSYQVDTNNVLTLHGLLKDVTCEDVCSKIKIEFVIYDKNTFAASDVFHFEVSPGTDFPLIDFSGDGGSLVWPLEKRSAAVNVYLGNIQFSSSYAEQNEESFFRVTEVEAYKANERGDETRKISVEFSCVLGNGVSNELVRMQNGSATIGFAIPSN